MMQLLNLYLVLGTWYETGMGKTEIDLNQAVYWYQRAAAQKYPEAIFRLGVCYFDGCGVDKDRKKAKTFITEALSGLQEKAKMGNAIAQVCLGQCYEKGWWIKRDNVEAFGWFHKAALQENAYAQHQLGVCFYLGNGVGQDDGQAFIWFEKAALQGDVRAQTSVGICYHEGRGVKKDDNKFFAWCEKAALNGYDGAQYTLGICYSRGYGVIRNDSKAAWWYCCAAQQSGIYQERAFSGLNGMLQTYDLTIEECEANLAKPSIAQQALIERGFFSNTHIPRIVLEYLDCDPLEKGEKSICVIS